MNDFELWENEYPQAVVGWGMGLEEGQNKPLDELVKKMQQVYVKMDETKAKAKAKVMAEFLWPKREELQGPRGPLGQTGWDQPQGCGRGIPYPAGESQPKQQLGKNQCAEAEGHWKQDCLQKQLDPQKEEVQRIMEMDC
ncbi:hypothetical protein HGM15179_018649 [Zosterops borbonicus]|uniref:Uncharacterized protein n=1 Tax=Zosterops borbonicus TaxID=364589 RepID=A0A8K1DBN5_9PASS|nr:hypothetical protein HGM15179_018649 [Zosterops borbonicus]